MLVWLFVIPRTVAHQASLSMEFSRQESWNEKPFPSPRGSSQPRDWTWVSHITGRFFTVWITRKAQRKWQTLQYFCLGTSHGQRSLVGYRPWGCKRVGHDLATKHSHTGTQWVSKLYKGYLWYLQKKEEIKKTSFITGIAVGISVVAKILAAVCHSLHFN